MIINRLFALKEGLNIAFMAVMRPTRKGNDKNILPWPAGAN